MVIGADEKSASAPDVGAFFFDEALWAATAERLGLNEGPQPPPDLWLELPLELMEFLAEPWVSEPVGVA